MTKYAVVRTASTNGVFNGPLVPPRDGAVYYVRRAQRSKRRGMWGILEVLIAQEPERALTWVNRETAERKAQEWTTDYAVYGVVEFDA